MKFYPAIDIKQGKCVRLYQGDMEKSKTYSDSPAEQAKNFQGEGAEWIHVVDLNGAFEGRPVNKEAVEEIINSVDVKIQLGGGIRNIETIEAWLNSGVERVILGTSALKQPELIIEACKIFVGKIAVGIDAWDEMVATDGWAEKSQINVRDLARKFEDAGVAAIIYTDISKDGVMQGVNLESTKRLAESISIPVIASGGVSSLDDLKKLKSYEEYGVEGVISGRAIYEKAFSVEQAIKALS